MKKPFKETLLGQWLQLHAPHLVDKVISLIPSPAGDVVAIVKNLISKTPLSESSMKDFSDNELDFNKEFDETEIGVQKELTSRNLIDTLNGDFLAKNIRPFSLIFLLLIYLMTIVLNYFGIQLHSELITMQKELLLLAFGFYFVGRSAEKVTDLKN